MQIADLPIQQLTDLTSEEQLAWMLAIRERRRLPPKPVRVPKMPTKRSKKNPLESMTKEQLERLLSALT